MAIAIPSVAEHFNADIPTAQWIFLAYFLTLSISMLPAGRLSDTLGRKRIYALGIVLFTIGGASLFFSPNLPMAILSKGIQGIGAGMITATTMAIPVAVLPATERGRGLGLFAALGSAGAITGLVIGGILLTAAGWRFAFLMPVALAVVAMASVALLLDETKVSSIREPTDRPGFDTAGALFSALGLLLFLLALSSGQRMGWGSPWIVAGLGGSAIVFLGFIVLELRIPSPMLDLRLFRSRALTLGAITRGLFMFATSSIGFLMPFYLQGILRLPASRAGLAMMTSGMAMVLVSPFGGALSDRYGRRLFMLLGLGFVAFGFCVLTVAVRYDHLYLLLAGLAMQGVGMGMFISPNLGVILGDVEPGKRGVAIALANLVRTASNLIGVAAAAAVVSGAMIWRGHAPKLNIAATPGEGAAEAFMIGAEIVFLMMAALCVLGALTSLCVTARRGQSRSET